MPSASHSAIDAAAYASAINIKPNVAFTVSAENLTVTTNSTSNDPDGSIVAYLWGWGDGGSNTSTTVPTASYTYTNAGTYLVVLTVTDDDGATSTASHSVTVTAPGDSSAPSAPTGVSATSGNTQISVTWNASTDNIAVTGYKVYVNGTQNKTTSSTSTIITGLVNGTTYSITVAAYDAAGNTSAQSTVDTAVPSGYRNAYVNDTGLGTNGGQQVTGSAYTLFNMSGSDVGVQASAVGTGRQLSVPVGTIQKLRGWNNQTVTTGADITAGGGIIGAGSSQTTISQVPNSSTGPSYLNGTPGDALIKVTTPNSVFQDFELLGTDQSVTIHHGFSVSGADDTTFRRLKLTQAGRGSLEKPPAESMALTIYNATGITVEDVEIDGGGVSASGFATNGSAGRGVIGDYTVTRLYTHDNWYSGGVALWQQQGNAVFNDCTWDNNRCHWNIERCTGSITINRPRIGALKAATSGWYDGSAAPVVGVFAESGNVPYPASDVQAFRFEIHDPRNLDGTPYSGPKITCQFGTSYDNNSPANKITDLWGRANFKAYDANGNDISSGFFTYTGTPAN